MAYVLDRDYDVMSRREKWDLGTQETVSRRQESEIGEDCSFSFLSMEEGECLRKIIKVLVPQYPDAEEIKIAEAIDGVLSHQKSGVRYGENLWKGEMYKEGLKEAGKLKEISVETVEQIFSRQSDDFLQRFFRMVLADATVVYFSHPASWNRIGFPGPAFPEGYAYLGCGEKDSWEPEYKQE